MKTLTLRFAEALWQRIAAYHLAPGKRREALSYLFCRVERVLGGMVLLAPADSPYFALAPDCFARQHGGNVRLRKDVQDGLLVEFAASDYNCLVNIHDHWFCDDAVFSTIDDADDLRFDRYLRERFEPMLATRPQLGPNRPIHNLSLVLGQQRHDARLTHSTQPRRALPVRALWRVGETLAEAPMSAAIPAVVDWASQARHGYLGSTTSKLARLRIGVAGCGGLGSVLAEALGRLGIRDLVLVDADQLETSNLNRWQGATPEDIGRNKAALLAERLRAMFPGMRCRAIRRELADPLSVAGLAACDVLIGGLDNDLARYQLTHLALQWMQPYFDAGVGIVTEPSVDFRSRYFAVIPDVTGCLMCKGVDLVDQQALTRALADRALLTEMRAAGYVVDVPDAAAPSSMLLNQRCASTLLTELLNFLAGWRPFATVISENWRSAHIQRLDRANFPEHPAEACPLCSFRIGAGNRLPIPRGGQAFDPAESLAEEGGVGGFSQTTVEVGS